jgi:hypothetical protein
MKIQSHGSFLDVSVYHGLFKMAAQIRLINLLIGYIIIGLIIAIRWYRRK